MLQSYMFWYLLLVLLPLFIFQSLGSNNFSITFFKTNKLYSLVDFKVFENRLYASVSCPTAGRLHRQPLDNIGYKSREHFPELSKKSIWLIGDSTLLSKAVYIAYANQNGNKTHGKIMQLFKTELGRTKSFYCMGFDGQGEVCFFYFMKLNEGFQSSDSFISGLQQKLAAKLNTNETPPDAIIFNYGLHALHMFPFQPLIGPFNFDLSLQRIFSYFKTKFPRTRLFYMLTQSVCAGNYRNEYANAIQEWYGLKIDVNLGRQQCQKEFLKALTMGKASDPESYYRLVGTKDESIVAAHLCASMILDDIGANYFNHIAYKVFKYDPDVQFLDGYALTMGKCNCSGIQDGRHYPPLFQYFGKPFQLHIWGTTDHSYTNSI